LPFIEGQRRRGLCGAVFGCGGDLTRAGHGRFYNHINGIGSQQWDRKIGPAIIIGAGLVNPAVYYAGNFPINSLSPAPGSILVDTDGRYVYYVLPEGKAIRY
jgi:hypothetical protein